MLSVFADGYPMGLVSPSVFRAGLHSLSCPLLEAARGARGRVEGGAGSG